MIAKIVTKTKDLDDELVISDVIWISSSCKRSLFKPITAMSHGQIDFGGRILIKMSLHVYCMHFKIVH